MEPSRGTTREGGRGRSVGGVRETIAATIAVKTETGRFAAAKCRILPPLIRRVRNPAAEQHLETLRLNRSELGHPGRLGFASGAITGAGSPGSWGTATGDGRRGKRTNSPRASSTCRTPRPKPSPSRSPSERCTRGASVPVRRRRGRLLDRGRTYRDPSIATSRMRILNAAKRRDPESLG